MSTFYSRDHELIFIHVPKCAGTTITSAILVAVNRGIASPAFRLENRRGSHPFAIEVRQRVGRKNWGLCWSFGVVRNPWDRLVSLHAFLRERDVISVETDFRSWLLGPSMAHKKDIPQSRWLYDGRRRIVNRVFRFERLNEAQQALSIHLRRPVVFNWYKKTEHGDYQSHYDERTKQWVQKTYAEDIGRYGYEF